MAPEMGSVKLAEGEEKKLDGEAWVLALARGISQVRVKTWNAVDGDWDERKLETVVVRGSDNGGPLLMRLPNVRRCPGLGTELSLFEQRMIMNPVVGGEDVAKVATAPSTPSDEMDDQGTISAGGKHTDNASGGIAVKLETEDLRTAKQKENQDAFQIVCWGKVSKIGQVRMHADNRRSSRRTRRSISSRDLSGAGFAWRRTPRSSHTCSETTLPSNSCTCGRVTGTLGCSGIWTMRSPSRPATTDCLSNTTPIADR